MNKAEKISTRIFRMLSGYLVAVGAVALATWLKWLAQPKIIPTDVPILYLMAIVPTAIFFGLGPSLTVCVLSFLAYDYYFLPPVHQLNFNIDQTPIMLIFLLVGVLFSYLASNLRRQNQVATKEIAARKQSEVELMKYRDHLEELVKLRTAELARSNEDLEQFAYVASHDLQEPLRAVGGYVKLLQHRFPEKLDAKAREYINGAADGAERMQRLIADLLAFSRVGMRGVAFAPADLNTLLHDALNNLQTSIKEAGAKVTSDPLPSLPVDATQIRQLFQNLIGNAIKFHSDLTPVIHVGARQEKERWLFWVQDNGIGIEPQYAGRIFQIFQRLHSRKHYPGTGIGLAICKKIVERHGGEIRVESQLAQGATFYFSIPEISAKMEPKP